MKPGNDKAEIHIRKIIGNIIFQGNCHIGKIRTLFRFFQWCFIQLHRIRKPGVSIFRGRFSRIQKQHVKNKQTGDEQNQNQYDPDQHISFSYIGSIHILYYKGNSRRRTVFTPVFLPFCAILKFLRFVRCNASFVL